MKTLYININGEAIKSDNNIEVIGSAEDSIVESFYISLGEAIAGGATGIKYKPLVADFANAKPNELKSFSDQWQEVKALLLGENPSGDYEFTLSSEYLDWLKMNATYSTIYYKKYQNQHQAKVKLNLDELYEDTVDAIRRKVIRFLQTDDKYKNFGEFVVNDYAATRRSLLVRSIKDKFEDIAFVLFEKWESGSQESGERDKAVCPKCGKNPCECENIKPNRDFLFVKVNVGNKKDDFVEVEILNEQNETLFKEKCRFVDSVWCETDDSGNYTVLVLEDYERYLIGEAHRYYRITNNSIERNLSEIELRQKHPKDKAPSDKDIKNLEKFFPQYKGGLEYIGKSGEDFIFYGIKDEDPEGAEIVDVITDKGEKLFELTRESGLWIKETTPSGLFLMEKSHDEEIAYYGIADKYGKELIPCIYGEHQLTNNNGHFDAHSYYAFLRWSCDGKYEVIPGIFTLDNGASFINAYNGDVYTNVKGNFGLRRKAKDNACSVDIVSLTDNHVVKENVTIDEDAELKELGDGWFGVDSLERSNNGFSVDELILLFNEKAAFSLNKDELVCELPNEQCFIGEGRIVTENMSEINIRNYSGQIIKSIKGGDIQLVAPYKFQKLIAKNISDSGLVYFDMSGNEHEISYRVSVDDEVCLVSENTILINNSRYNKYRLIDVNGNVLLDRNEPIVPLNEKYLLLRDRKKYGVVDVNGKMFIAPLYFSIYILKS